MKILVATDGSDFSREAAENCCDFICQPEAASVRILSIYQAQVPMAAEPFAVSAEYYGALDRIAENNAKAAADRTKEIIRKRFPNAEIDLSTEVDLGRPAELIVEAAKDWGADLIVVGSHGRGFWGRLTLGSVSDAVVHHAPCSVLIVRSPEKDF